MTSQKNKPNILFLFSDQHKANVFSHAGNPDVKTPNFDGLAAESVCFQRAYCQNGVCAPSRASMMSGQYCRELDHFFNNQIPDLDPSKFLPLQELLNQNGYTTVAFGKRHLAPALDRGWDYTATTMVDHDLSSDEFYLDWVTQKGQKEAFARDWQAEFGKELAAPMASLISELKPEHTMEAYTAKKTVEFLREQKNNDQPFFLWSSFYRPHQPYTPVQKYAEMYDPSEITLPETLNESADHLPPFLRNLREKENGAWCIASANRRKELWRRYIAYYYALVTEIDNHVGAILQTLEEEGLAKDTIVIYSSDHGEFVGSHGIVSKAGPGHNMYEDTLRVPLMIRWPEQTKSHYVTDDLVELIDLYPTLLEAAGIKKAEGDCPPGYSLVPVFKQKQSLGRRYAVSENKVQLTAIGERYKLSLWNDPKKGDYTDVLFDLEKDPLETENLIGCPEMAVVEQEMRQFLSNYAKQKPI